MCITINLPIKINKSILALGSEFDTRMALYRDGEIIFSENTGETAEQPERLEKFIFNFLRNVSILTSRSDSESILKTSPCPPPLRRGDRKPDIIITDLHPLYNSRKIGEKLAKKWNASHITVQHHIAHIFSAVADYSLKYNSSIHGLTPPLPPSRGELFDFYGIACDGTGYGLDGNIWGGEVFRISVFRTCLRRQVKEDFFKDSGENRDLIDGLSFTHGKIPPPPLWERGELTPYPPPPLWERGELTPYPPTFFWEKKGRIQRIGHLEEQYLIGGELAVEEPARMAISILSKFLGKHEVFTYIKRYYSENDFNLLWNQLEQKFNCAITTSAGRVLDAVSLLLGFCKNERKYKHYPVKMLEKHTNMRMTRIYEWQRISSIKPKIKKENNKYILDTTNLFRYLIDNLGKIDSDKLAYLAQRYIIEGLYEIARLDYPCIVCRDATCLRPSARTGRQVNRVSTTVGQKGETKKVFFSGGLAENKIMRNFAVKNNIYVPQEKFCGDAGIAIGQIMVFLLNRVW